MKIVKESKMGSQEFTCDCGTSFVAKRKEYNQRFDDVKELVGYVGGFLGLFQKARYKVTPSVRFSCRCPHCRSAVYKWVATGESKFVDKEIQGM